MKHACDLIYLNKPLDHISAKSGKIFVYESQPVGNAVSTWSAGTAD